MMAMWYYGVILLFYRGCCAVLCGVMVLCVRCCGVVYVEMSPCVIVWQVCGVAELL